MGKICSVMDSDLQIKDIRIKIKKSGDLMIFNQKLFCNSLGELMVTRWLEAHSDDYTGGKWNSFFIRAIEGVTLHATGYIAPDTNHEFHIQIPGNYFDGKVSADAAGIIATIMVMNRLSWVAAESGVGYEKLCRILVERQDALKDYISNIKHPERYQIYRAID